MLVTLQSNDNVTAEIDLDDNDDQIKLLGEVFQGDPLMQDDTSEKRIPLPMVEGRELLRMMDFFHLCLRLKKEDTSFEVEKRQKSSFIDKFDSEELIQLTIAANYMNYDNLVDCACERIARMIRGKSPEEIRQIFHIENDISPTDAEKIRQENEWIFS